MAFAEEKRMLEEIVVTATRVETTLQDTSIAVSAFNSDTMDDMNLSSAMDYEALVPSLSIQLSPNRTSIRGVGRFDNSLGIAPGVAMYEDGAYSQENTALGSNPMNTERVEIMRGPQGTLFGRNTTGGATNIIKKKPTDDFYLEARLGTGNYGRHNAEALISGPIFDSVRGKIYHNQWTSDGLYDNRGGKDTKGEAEGTQAYTEWMLDWQATDNLFIFYKGGHLDTNTLIGGTSFFTGYDPYNVCTSSLGGWCAQYQQVQAGIEEPMDIWDIDINSVGKVGLDDSLTTTLHVTYDFESVQVKYIGYHNHYDWYQTGMDYDSTSNLEIGQINNIAQDQRITTHEITFNSTDDSPLQWIAGYYYLDDENYQPWELVDMGTNTGMVNVLDPSFYCVCEFITEDWIVGQNPDLIYYHQSGTFYNENWSVFGEVNYQINDEWTVTLGIRYSEDDLKGVENQIVYADTKAYVDPAWYDWCYLYDPNGCINEGVTDSSSRNQAGEFQYQRTSKKTFDDTSGRIIIDYSPDENNLYWLTISNAFKVGGLRLGNMQGLSTGESPFFDGEEVTMYELGWKGAVTDTLNVEAIGFFYDYSDMQQLRWYRNDVGISLGNVINVDSEMSGIELQAQWLATGNLMLFATYSYNNAEFSETMWMHEQEIELHCDTVNEFGDCMINIDGNKLDITPDHKLAVNAMYTMYTTMGEFAFGGTVSYVGERYMDIFNSPELEGDSYTRLDLSASWTSNDGQWRVKTWVQNATDEEWFNTKSVDINSNEGTRFPATKYLRYSGNPANPRFYNFELQYML
jgi:iron complex outermembrane receptor protein